MKNREGGLSEVGGGIEAEAWTENGKRRDWRTPTTGLSHDPT
jgi:hypothetical protein